MAVAGAAVAAVGGVEFFGGGVADGEDGAVEAHCAAGQGMVEVENHAVGFHFFHEAVDAEAVGGHHGHVGAGHDVFVVKFAVDQEEVFFEGGDLLGVVGAESFVGGGADVEFRADFQAVDCFFEGLDHAAGHAEDDFFGVGLVGLMHQFFGAVGVDLIEVVAQLHIFSGNDFFHISKVLSISEVLNYLRCCGLRGY